MQQAHVSYPYYIVRARRLPLVNICCEHAITGVWREKKEGKGGKKKTDKKRLREGGKEMKCGQGGEGNQVDGNFFCFERKKKSDRLSLILDQYDSPAISAGSWQGPKKGEGGFFQRKGVKESYWKEPVTVTSVR